jgi:hypothetical protein
MTFGYAVESAGSAVGIVYSGATPASIFEIPAGLPSQIHRLVKDQLTPGAAGRGANYILYGMGPGHFGAIDPQQGIVRPFLVSSDQRILAGSFRRLGGLAECWCLPEFITDYVSWSRAAVAEWSRMDLQRFPQPTPWTLREEWLTRAETELLVEEEELRQELARYLDQFSQRSDILAARRQAATASADVLERALLTHQGNELKIVVAAALTGLGFAVEDMDPSWKQFDMREDLRVRDPDDQAWIAIAEVRGYKGGATLKDLMRIQGRFGKRFQKDEGRWPDRLWYVVNHQIEEDPGARGVALASHRAEVQTFAEEGGLIIDTVDLFKLWKAVDLGNVDQASARASLRTATGNFSTAAVESQRKVAVSTTVPSLKAKS